MVLGIMVFIGCVCQRDDYRHPCSSENNPPSDNIDLYFSSFLSLEGPEEAVIPFFGKWVVPKKACGKEPRPGLMHLVRHYCHVGRAIIN